MLELPFYNTFFQTATPPAIELAAQTGRDRAAGHWTGSSSPTRARKPTIPSSSFVRSSGTCRGDPGKKRSSARRNGYHGATLARPASPAWRPCTRRSDLPLPGFSTSGTLLVRPKAARARPRSTALQWRSALEDRSGARPREGRGVYRRADPGCGGVIIPPPSYWPEVQRICRKYDLLLVADEVITGFGRTGNWWGSEPFGIAPDIITAAKGCRRATCRSRRAVAPRVGEALFAKPARNCDPRLDLCRPSGRRAVALENIAMIEQEGCYERAREPDRRLFRQGAGDPGRSSAGRRGRSGGLIAALELSRTRRGRRLVPARAPGRPHLPRPLLLPTVS